MSIPFAEQYRPKTLIEFEGQEVVVGKDSAIAQMIDIGELSSMIFWGPPACGKTTLARLLAKQMEYQLHTLSAVSDGKDALRKVLAIAESNELLQQQTLLFVDEIHRWNKAQQDALLPYVESGLITLLGATTENPSFSVNSALLSRCRLVIFEQHKLETITKILKKVVKENKILLKEDQIIKLAKLSDGDMRFGLNTLQLIKPSQKITDDQLHSLIQKAILYDRNGDEHYNLISAVHKSLRSSNPDAALYWVFRMLAGGEDPRYIIRRLIRFASEDIGNANPNALLLANQVYDVIERVGMPESETAIVQLVEYLGNSPKSNDAYMAVAKVKQDIKEFGNLPVPFHFRNAPTSMMKNLGYGKGYEYDHDLKSGKSDQKCLPKEIENTNYFGKNKNLS
jgi:putative ATPase